MCLLLLPAPNASASGNKCCACWGTGVFGGASCTGLNHGVLAVGLGEVRVLLLLLLHVMPKVVPS